MPSNFWFEMQGLDFPTWRQTWAMWVQNVSEAGGSQLTEASVDSQLFKAWQEGI